MLLTLVFLLTTIKLNLSFIGSLKLRPNYCLDISNRILFTKLGTSSSVLESELHSSVAVKSNWVSSVSINSEFDDAVIEIIQNIKSQTADLSQFKIAILFVSSIYDPSSFQQSTITAQLKASFPNLVTLIGCSTGTVVGPLLSGISDAECGPSEIESRASVGITFLPLENIDQHVLRMSPDDISDYLKDDRLKSFTSNNNINIIFSTESSKPTISDLLTQFKLREKVEAVGLISSAVTSLHVPKLFYTTFGNSENPPLEKFTDGALVLTLSGNIAMKNVIARSSLPVGPIYEVTSSKKNEILLIKDLATQEIQPPLVHLDTLLQHLPSIQSDALKKELLIAVDIINNNSNQDRSVTSCLGQKPTSFDPYTGSISIPSVPVPTTTTTSTDASAAAAGSTHTTTTTTFQFCIRDSYSTRKDFQRALSDVSDEIHSSIEAEGSELLGLLMLGSVERGNKIFRYQNWESSQLHYQMLASGAKKSAPLFGLYTAGSLTTLTTSVTSTTSTANVNNEIPFCPLMETDSLYILLTSLPKTKSTSQLNNDPSKPDSSQKNSVPPADDVLTIIEKQLYNDNQDSVIISKRDPESAHAVRVASMDYFVPAKLPQPRNVLESLVWDREKEIDRTREKFPTNRALLLARTVDKKFPNRKLAIGTKEGSKLAPVLLLSYLSSPYHDKANTINDVDKLRNENIQQLCKISSMAGKDIIAVGTHADGSNFKGAFEDLQLIKENTALPVICDDFILYGYQLFRAKGSGANMVKLYASILPVKDIIYLMKTAKVLNLDVIVVVSAKKQLLEVLVEVEDGLDMIAVTSRNMRVWKIDAGKATGILKDPEVLVALADYQKKRQRKQLDVASVGEGDGVPSVTTASKLLIFQEGFANKEELLSVRQSGLVDGVLLGEELLRPPEGINSDSNLGEISILNLVDTVNGWLGE